LNSSPSGAAAEVNSVRTPLPTAALAITLLAGCAPPTPPPGDHRAASSVDAWFNPPPPSMPFTTVEPDRVIPVSADLQPEAQVALTDVAFQRLTADEAARLAGKRLPAGTEYFLLRGVVLNEGTGRFALRMGGQAVHVYHGCLGRRPVPMRKKAVVATLPTAPAEVYASCGMAE
jgi:hypothetical protein